MLGHLFLVIVIAFSISTGCSQNYSDEKAEDALREEGFDPVKLGQAKAQDTGGSTAAEGRISLGGISVIMPQGWQNIAPSSSMRVAEFHLSGQRAGAEEGILAVFQLGGSVESNIARWYGQMAQPDGGSTEERARRWEKQVGGLPVTLVDLKGTYAGMGAMGRATEPSTDFRMLAAVVEAPQGLFFFKLVGPAATLALWEQSFENFIDSIEKE